MFALDDALADAFRSLSKGKRDKDAKEKKKQIITFKIRCVFSWLESYLFLLTEISYTDLLKGAVWNCF